MVWGHRARYLHVPNKRFGGVTLGGKIAPIFSTPKKTFRARCRLKSTYLRLKWATWIAIHPYDGKITKDGQTVAEFALKSPVLLDEVRAGGRINLIIGRALTAKARGGPGFAPVSTAFRLPAVPEGTGGGFTLAQKWWVVPVACPRGKVCCLGRTGEPRMTTVGSQDTTGPMTRDELKDLACLGQRRFGDAVVLSHRGLSQAS